MMKTASIASGLFLLIAAVLNLAPAEAQQYVISTYAGGGAPPPTPAPGVDLVIVFASAVAADAAGNVYFATNYFATHYGYVFKLDRKGIVTRVAGNSPRLGYSGDGGPATSAQLSHPTGVAVDGTGNLFIADSNNYCIRKVSPDGIITTVAGNGTHGYSGDDGPPTGAQLGDPGGGVAVDGAGNLFIADRFKGRIRKVSPDGIITTVAGRGPVLGDGGLAISALLISPQGMAMDSAGNLFIADFSGGRIRKVSPDGIITTVAGNGIKGFSGDGGPATGAQLSDPTGVAVDGAGNLFIADSSSWRIRKVSPDGIITTVAGNGTYGFSGDGGPATGAQLGDPIGVAVDGAGNLFIADYGNLRIRKVSPDGIITTVAGGGKDYPALDGVPATSVRLLSPSNVAVDGAGNLFIAESDRDRLKVFTPYDPSKNIVYKVSPSGR